MKKIIFILIIIVLIAGGVYYFVANPKGDDIDVKDTSNTGEQVTLDGPTQTYTNPTYRFSFEHPSVLTVTSTSQDDGVESIVAYDAETQAGFQIQITPIDEDIDALTVERIKQDLPDILIESPQDVVLGSSGRGVAFVSDDPTFDGRSREVWFVFNKYLYQIRTYMKYDEMLKSVLNTWQFDVR